MAPYVLRMWSVLRIRSCYSGGGDGGGGGGEDGGCGEADSEE